MVMDDCPEVFCPVPAPPCEASSSPVKSAPHPLATCYLPLRCGLALSIHEKMGLHSALAFTPIQVGKKL